MGTDLESVLPIDVRNMVLVISRPEARIMHRFVRYFFIPE